MQIKVNKKIGDITVQFEFDVKGVKEAFGLAAFLSEKDYCYLDGFQDSNVFWQERRVKGKEGTDKAGQTFIYIERKARSKDGRWATSQMGEYQDGSGYYWKKWEVYEPENTGIDTSPKGQIDYPVNDGENIPF